VCVCVMHLIHEMICKKNNYLPLIIIIINKITILYVLFGVPEKIGLLNIIGISHDYCNVIIILYHGLYCLCYNFSRVWGTRK